MSQSIHEFERTKNSSPRILAVMVLYKRTPETSETFTSLREILRRRSDLAGTMILLVYDNSPAAQEIPALPVATRYISNTENGGLVPAYNAGLQLADKEGASWLLLLDQDTVLTEAYFAELIPTLSNVGTPVSAVLPKLVLSGRESKIISPHYIPRLFHRGIDAEFSGMAMQELSAVNSAAILRVSALNAIGGFPTEHPIEFVDHTVFHLLQSSGGRIWVMDSVLLHNPSLAAPGRDLSLDRYKNVLSAERDFYMNRRGAPDRIWYRLRKIKAVISRLLKVRDKRFALWDLRAALGALKKRS